MFASEIFFYGVLFFLAGVFLASIGFGFWAVVLITGFIAAVWLAGFLFLRKRKSFWPALLVLLVIAGFFYYRQDDKKFRAVEIPFNQEALFRGVIVKEPVLKLASQEITVKLAAPENGRVLVKLPRHPVFDYGDKIVFAGRVQKIQNDDYGLYLAKERIKGVSLFPKIEKEAVNQGSALKKWLLAVKNKTTGVFEKVLPFEEASFLSGLILGDRSDFSAEFKEAMNLSGTTHLVALSGYNITIISLAAMAIFLFFFSRRWAFGLTFLTIIGFVIMTGAEASVVRAAIMGGLALLAQQAGRLYSVRNAIMAAALVMILVNPKTLTFDVGFQLSFCALLGIVYLKPALAGLSKFFAQSGFLSWRENLLTTASAQLAVLPILIGVFGRFSVTSILANVIILELVPVTMALGFLTAAAGFVSYYSALIFGWLVFGLLYFETKIIHLFAVLSIPLKINLSVLLTVLYYLTLIVFVFYMRHYVSDDKVKTD